MTSLLSPRVDRRRRAFASLLLFAAIAGGACGGKGDATVSATVAKYKFVPTSAFTLHAAAPPDLRMKLVSKVDGGFLLLRPANSSVGTFVAQTTFAVANEKKHDGVGRGILRFFFTSGPLTFLTLSVQARYDPTIHGFVASVVTSLSPTPLADPVSFPSLHQIDVRIEQTDSSLAFYARETPNPPSSDGGYTLLLEQPAAVTEESWVVGAGVDGLAKGAAYYLNNFALDGPTIGGATEGPIVAALRACIDQLAAAKTELALPVPNLTVVATALDNASADLGSAQTDLTAAITGAALQPATLGASASASLVKGAKALATAKTAVATLDVKKAKAKLKSIEGAIDACFIAVAALMGEKAPNAKALRALFALHAPATG